MTIPRILIVEDEVVVAEDIGDTLQRLGYVVVSTASTGEEAIAKARQEKPDLVLMDIRLHGHMDGIDAAEQIQDRLDIPVVFLTAHSDEQTLQRAQHTRPFGYVIKPFQTNELQAAVMMACDKHKLEKTLKDSRKWYASTLASIGSGVIATDAEGTVTLLNPVAESLTGWTQLEAIGANSGEVFRAIEERARDEVENPLRQALMKGEAIDPLKSVILLSRDGNERLIDHTAAPIRDADGKITGAVMVFRDVSEQRRHQELVARLRQMEAVGQLAGGVAHDINNALTVILGYSEVLLDTRHPGDTEYEAMLRIKESGQRVASLTQKLLVFSGRHFIKPVRLDLNVLLLGLWNTLPPPFGPDIDYVTALDPHLWPVNLDPIQAQQVVVELTSNATYAMPQGGKIIVETHNVEFCQDDVGSSSEATPGRYVLLTVRDTGVGMDQETKTHLFEPFFTTKAFGQGSGLGLASIHGIVHHCGGHIKVVSELGQGTTFSVYFPAVEELAPPQAVAPEILMTQSTETVLVVDHDAAVRSMARMILETQGYHVLEAGGGEDALTLCKRHDGPIHLVLANVIMPDMNGNQFAGQLVPVRPTAKVLFVSGYSDEMIRCNGLLEPDRAFLQKPFSPAALTTKVRELLDS